MARPIIDPNFHIHLNGVPIENATFAFFISGTSTPQAVYDDPALSNSVGTTIDTNSAGRVETIAYADPRVAYKCTLTIPGGPTITADPFITAEAELGSIAPENGWYLEAVDTVSLRVDNVEVTEVTSGRWLMEHLLRMSNKRLEFAESAGIAAAASTDLSAMTGNSVSISGAAIITSFGTVQAGFEATLTFQGASRLTHNSTSFILPGAADIITDAGSVGKFVSLGSGNWRCTSFRYANGLPGGFIIATVQGTPVALSNSATTPQNVFASDNDVLQLAAATTYFFELQFIINTGATSHTTALGLVASSAFTSIKYLAELWSTTAGTISTTAPSFLDVTVDTATVLNAASTATRTTIRARGIIRTNAASTMTPQITFSAGPTGTCEVATESYFRAWPIGADTLVSFGSWS